VAQEYVLVRLLPGGNEVVLETIPVTAGSTGEVTTALRETILASGRGRKLAAPGQRFILYGPTEENVPRTADDRVWDSAVDL